MSAPAPAAVARRRLLVVAVALGIALAVGPALGLGPSGPAPVEAQSAPPTTPTTRPAVPLPLDPLAPVFELLGPTLSPVCGGVGIVGFLSPALLGDLASFLLPLLGPVYTLCGAVPTTPDEERFACTLDTEAQLLIGSITGPLAGIGPVLDLRPVGQVLDQLAVIVDRLPPPLGLRALLNQASVVLQCQEGITQPEPPSGPPPTFTPSTPTTAPPASTPPATSPTPRAPTLPRTPVTVAPRPPVTTTTTPATAPATDEDVAGVPVASPGANPRVPFRHPIVFAFPFALLAGGAAVGRLLLRPAAGPMTASHGGTRSP